jgi:hypothetical protein
VANTRISTKSDRWEGEGVSRRGIDTGERLGRHRWKIERTIAWLTGYRRLTIPYERTATLGTPRAF